MPLERRCVRFLDNFSRGMRGALCAECAHGQPGAASQPFTQAAQVLPGARVPRRLPHTHSEPAAFRSESRPLGAPFRADSPSQRALAGESFLNLLHLSDAGAVEVGNNLRASRALPD